MSPRAYIAGSGTYLPGDPIAYEDIGRVLGELPDAPEKLRKWMATTEPVLRQVLDIRVVHYAFDPVTRQVTDDNVSMAVAASRSALADASMEPAEIDLICYGSAHQDQMPTASTRIQEQLGIERCAEFSIHANCTSAYKALYLADRLLRAGEARNALVVSASVSSSELRAEYLNQPLLDKESIYPRWFLCDGAGALVLTADPARGRNLLVELGYVESIGGRREPLMYNGRPAYWMNPREEFEKGLHHLKQGFKNTLSSAVFQEEGGSVFFNGLRRMLARGGIPADSIRYFQLNLPAKHIVASIQRECASIGIPESAFYMKLDELGYCGPPMALICLDKILREEPLGAGDRVVSFVTEVSKFMQAGYSIRHVG